MASGFPDWLRAFTMVGKHDTEYKVVLVDEEGNLYALLQGETADEELRTVRLDDEGRISAFIIDSSDAWARMLSIGNAELAARLGSPVNYDRRGQVIIAEDFETGWARWELYEVPAGAGGELVPTTSATGGYCVHLTGGSDGSQEARITFHRGALPLGRVGIEFSFAIDSEVLGVFANVNFNTPTHNYLSSFKWVYTGNLLQVFDDTDGYVTVGTGKLAKEEIYIFNTVKLVYDLTTGKYVRLMFNQQEIPIDTRDIRDLGTDDPPGVRIGVGVISRALVNDDAYFDDIILTFGEPE